MDKNIKELKDRINDKKIKSLEQRIYEFGKSGGYYEYNRIKKIKININDDFIHVNIEFKIKGKETLLKQEFYNNSEEKILKSIENFFETYKY